MTNGKVRKLGAVACALVLGFASTVVLARSADVSRDRYIVILEEKPLVAQLAANSGLPAGKQDLKSQESLDYLRHLEEGFLRFKHAASAQLGRELLEEHRYRYGLNGFSARLAPHEAETVRGMQGVEKVVKDRVHRLNTDSGPKWLGAHEIWTGDSGAPASRGEGIVVGIIDSGINWDHASFQDQYQGGYDHDNPYGEELGLCSEPEVACNDKLIGVYDFVEDDPDSEEVEEFNSGFDNINHGSLSASIVAGNPINLSLGNTLVTMSGVAPRANLISYRVCYTDDPDDPGDDACLTSFIVRAIDQAIADGVDVINASVGTPDSFSPWGMPSAIAYLNAFEAGIFAVTSAGNDGPGVSSLGSPGNAPWMTAVGAATHDRWVGNPLLANQGGLEPLGTLYGMSLSEESAGPLPIVHAGDFGNALCGEGTPELPASCAEATGNTNPFDPGTFNGMIVVCDRGTYGRIEKGKNVMDAGAAGYVLANTASNESMAADEHCLAATQLDNVQGDMLRDWLDQGSGHRASILGFGQYNVPELGDQLASFSSRGPNLAPAEDVMKPNLIGPGVSILGAGNDGSTDLLEASGTSFSSPHVAGAAALLKSANHSLTPSMLSSMLELTATPDQAIDYNGKGVTTHERGAGRPRLGKAINAGFYLEETADNFFAANPDSGGEPGTLNLPSMTEGECVNSCSFTRSLTPLVPGAQWTATANGFPDGVVVTVSPAQFTLNEVGQNIRVDVDLAGAGVLNDWIYGQITFTSPDLPDANMPVSVFSSGNIVTDGNGGWRDLGLGGYPAMSHATFIAGGLTEPTVTTMDITQDPSDDDPYDGGEGVFTVLHEVPDGALWLHASTPASVSADVDLFIGRDDNNDGKAQREEEVCSSTTPEDLEVCDELRPEEGTWWILVQNWDDGVANSDPAQAVTLVSGVVAPTADSNLMAAGPGILSSGEDFKVRMAWENVSAVPGEYLLGAVGIGSRRNSPNNVEVIFGTVERGEIAAPGTTALYNGRSIALAVDSGQTHDKIFIDVPPGANSLNIEVNGRNSSQTNSLDVSIGRVGFDEAFANAPLVAGYNEVKVVSRAAVSTPQAAVVPGENGLAIELGGNDLTPGRYYVLVTNNGANPASVTVDADMEFDEDPIPLHAGLFEPASRPGIKQGFELNGGALLWYTYGEDGLPVWYLGSGTARDGNTWTTDLLRFTNDGSAQQFTRVGTVSVTILDSKDVVFSWTLYGESGSDRMKAISAHSCPEVDGVETSFTGIWYRGSDGLGGASVLVNAASQAQVHYLYDDSGNPRWLIGGGSNEQEELALQQWTGFCPLCEGNPTFEQVGVLGVEYGTETNGRWTLDYVLEPPLSGDVDRTDTVVKLTETIECK